MLTTKEAAAVLGIQPRTVTRYILRGLIRAEKHGRDYFISHDEIARFQNERRKVGNPGTPRKKKESTE
jgi:excisionase family DNA binding protein